MRGQWKTAYGLRSKFRLGTKVHCTFQQAARMLRGCLWLTVVLFLSVSIVTCADCTERHHHHQHHQPPCPNCVQPAEQKRDEIRLETIKRQILSKLGLKEKPNVTSPVPREVILETLYRAEETGGHQDGNRGAGLVTQHVLYDDDSSPAPSSTRPPESEPDDFYGRTSEIIAFAEPGKKKKKKTQVLSAPSGGATPDARTYKHKAECAKECNCIPKTRTLAPRLSRTPAACCSRFRNSRLF